MSYMTPGKSGVLSEVRNTPPPPKQKKKMRGLGDLVKKLFQMVGIEVVVKKATKGRDCGCERRREALNRAVPFGRDRTENEG